MRILPPSDPPEQDDAAGQFERIHALAEALGDALTPQQVAEIVLEDAFAGLPLVTGGVWKLPEGASEAILLASRGWRADHYETFARIRPGDANPVGMTLTGKEFWLLSRAEYAAAFPAIEAKARVEGRPDIAIVSLPLRADGRIIGAVTVSLENARPLTPSARRFLSTLARLCAQAMRRAKLFESLRDSRAEAVRLHAAEARSAARMALAARVGDTLASSLDYEATLKNVIGICIPALGDFGFFDVREESEVRRVALAHENPERQAIIDQSRWARSERTDMNLCALSSGAPAVHPDIDDEWLRAVAVNDGHYQVMKMLSFGSMLTVPLSYNGDLLGALTLFYDASGRKHDADDVLTAQDIARRAAMALVNARLLRDARAAVAVRDDFLSVASHELRTPLTSAKLHLQGLSREFGGSAPIESRERIVHKLGRTTAQLDRLTGLVDQLLDVSRLAAGRLVLERERLDLAVLTRDVVSRFEHELKRIGTEVRLSAAGEVVGNWDKSRLDQVVTNLISNALKYGEDKPIDVTIEASDGVARLRVRDRGLGIDARDHRRIFERFERASSIRKYGGIGLGLWIVKQIVDLHRGQISVASEPGQGAEFSVALPLDA